ncbi:CocE/NonD family hydrolase [Streptomyces peucetius]|uniref:CocE/NonD family hydrolase n=1 Tax=Streptomyces peucetius TaxID=1950 RepID=A0ABY6IAL1_STRPE|nr:CocE/NonD family hydrolase [Streptomyces peucetius]UYQ63744.1 CocE/NonD family hydrolase [Streptomyces peucetius]
MRIRTDFPYETVHADVRVPLPDGTRLHARVWRPVTDEPVPALLEYAPHRLTDATAVRDGERHPWYAGHGYASVRVDVRGHGNSEGVPGGEYDAIELADGVTVIEWLSRRPWCSGRVGMFGIGRGARNALRIAALAPGPLRAVVVVDATDDPYDNDGPYVGGCVAGQGLHSKAAERLALAARPPDPLHAGDEWLAMWLARLESLRPVVHTWLGHRLRDEYWLSAGVSDDTAAVAAAVLAVSGLHDPGRDTVLRLVERLPSDRVRGLIGPWQHQYPDRAPERGGHRQAIGFLQETLRWWDQWLKDGRDTGVMSEPLLRCRLEAAGPAQGRWAGEPAWPSPNVTVVPHSLGGGPVVVGSPRHTGVDAGRYRPAGHEADLPPDQREEDARSVCFEFPVGEDPVAVLGRPRVTLRLSAEGPDGVAVARLCDIAPDGAATLVTRGALNLAAREGPDRAVPWPVGATEDVSFDLAAAGHVFAPGHRIRLAVSCAYWPWVWPHPGPAGFTLDPAGSRLDLPVREPTGETVGFAEPEHAQPPAVAVPQTLDAPRSRLLLVRDVPAGRWTLEATPHRGGTHIHPDGLEYTEECHETYTVEEADPLSARTRSEWVIRLHRPEEAWDVHVWARSEIHRDEAGFLTSDELVCRSGDEIVFHRTWERRIGRPAG